MDLFNRRLYGRRLSARGLKNIIKTPLASAFLQECSSNSEAVERFHIRPRPSVRVIMTHLVHAVI